MMTTRKATLRAAALALVATVGLATGAGAQWRVTAFGGVYTPTNDVGNMSETVGGTTGTVALKHQTGFTVGLNANRWFAESFGFEGTFAYVNSDAKTTASLTGDLPISGSQSYGGDLYIGAAKLLYGITPHTSPQLFYVSGGPAVIGASGSAYNAQNGIKTDRSTSFGGVLGVGARLHMTDLLCLKLGADDYMYNAHIKMYDTTDPTSRIDFGSKFQNDLVFSAGVSLLTPW